MVMKKSSQCNTILTIKIKLQNFARIFLYVLTSYKLIKQYLADFNVTKIQFQSNENIHRLLA